MTTTKIIKLYELKYKQNYITHFKENVSSFIRDDQQNFNENKNLKIICTSCWLFELIFMKMYEDFSI